MGYNSSSSTSSGSSKRSSTQTRSTRTTYSSRSSKGKHETSSKNKQLPPPSTDENRRREASVATYVSTDSSEDEGITTSKHQRPRLRRTVYPPDAIPASAPDFAELFPSTRKLLVHHDDTTADGSMNLRVDAEIFTTKGRRVKMTLFHLRMSDIAERNFSLRRYCRDSGREVCHCSRKYEKPGNLIARKWPAMPRSIAAAVQSTGKKDSPPQQDDSGYESDDDDVDEELRIFTSLAEVRATIPTDTIRFEFSNYAQVELHRSSTSEGRSYPFEYWGKRYRWQTPVEKYGPYNLFDLTTGKVIAQINSAVLSRQEQMEEELEGSWIPPSTIQITDENVAVSEKADLADVIVATGLSSLVDNNIKHQRGLSVVSRPRRTSATDKVPRTSPGYTKHRR